MQKCVKIYKDWDTNFFPKSHVSEPKQGHQRWQSNSLTYLPPLSNSTFVRWFLLNLTFLLLIFIEIHRYLDSLYRIDSLIIFVQVDPWFDYLNCNFLLFSCAWWLGPPTYHECIWQCSHLVDWWPKVFPPTKKRYKNV